MALSPAACELLESAALALTEGGAADLLQRLAHVHLGPDVRFPPMDDPPPGIITHISVERISGMGDWET